MKDEDTGIILQYQIAILFPISCGPCRVLLALKCVHPVSLTPMLLFDTPASASVAWHGREEIQCIMQWGHLAEKARQLQRYQASGELVQVHISPSISCR